jgi:hypothetical protein
MRRLWETIRCLGRLAPILWRLTKRPGRFCVCLRPSPGLGAGQTDPPVLSGGSADPEPGPAALIAGVAFGEMAAHFRGWQKGYSTGRRDAFAEYTRAGRN